MRPGSLAKESGKQHLRARRRASAGVLARYTSPMPPAPDRRKDFIGSKLHPWSQTGGVFDQARDSLPGRSTQVLPRSTHPAQEGTRPPDAAQDRLVEAAARNVPAAIRCLLQSIGIEQTFSTCRQRSGCHPESLSIVQVISLSRVHSASLGAIRQPLSDEVVNRRFPPLLVLKLFGRGTRRRNLVEEVQQERLRAVLVALLAPLR